MNSEERQCCSNWQLMSPEIVEIGEEKKSSIGSRDEGTADVYVAVGKNDLDVIRWVLNHGVLPGTRVFLVHVFSPIAYIPTPGNNSYRLLVPFFANLSLRVHCLSQLVWDKRRN